MLFKHQRYSYISLNDGASGIHFTPYSPTVTGYMCAGVAALPHTRVWVFGRVVAIALSLNDLTMRQTLRVVHHDEWCMHNKFNALHFPSGNGPLLSMLHFKGLL